MISQGQFQGQIEQIEHSFDRNLKASTKDGWFKEMEYCDYPIFKITMQKLKKGDKFPNFGMFWVQYNIAKKSMLGEEAESRGCDKCRSGYIHFLEFDKAVNGKVERTGFCKHCYPENKRAVDPCGAFEYQPGMEPWKQKNSKDIPAHVAKAMIQELCDKITRRSVDWEKETKDAWDFHERVGGRV